MEQDCKDCKHSDNPENVEPCNSCEWTEVFSNFTPKKDLNQLLREKLGQVRQDVEFEKQHWGHTTDAVKQPSHYMLKEGLEVRDVLEILADKIRTPEANTADWKPAGSLFISDYVQMMQYLMRFMDKNGVEDLRKASWYLDKLIEAYE